MINLNTKIRDLENINDLFYAKVKNKLIERIDENLLLLNEFITDKSNLPLGNFIKKNIENLIRFPLDELLYWFKPELDAICKKHYIKDSPFQKAIDNIFFFEEHDRWLAYQLTIDLKINTCPYCNRNYITTLGTDNEKFFRGDFDHFLAKSEFPYLRFSFYNIIPCCILCNRNAKKAGQTSLQNNIYPYEEGFNNDTLFTFIPESYDDLIGNGNPKISFLYLGNNEHILKSKANVKLFRLDEQYSIHFRELNDLINKRRILSNSYLKELQKNYPNLIQSFEEAYLIAFGKEFDLARDENRPLSKFTRDLVVELGLIVS